MFWTLIGLGASCRAGDLQLLLSTQGDWVLPREDGFLLPGDTCMDGDMPPITKMRITNPAELTKVIPREESHARHHGRRSKERLQMSRTGAYQLVPIRLVLESPAERPQIPARFAPGVKSWRLW